MPLPPHLVPTSKVDQVPADSFLLNNMQGDLYYVERKHFNAFACSFIAGSYDSLALAFDLAFARVHALVFDIDFKGEHTHQDVLHYVERVLQPVLVAHLHAFPYLTLILATRPGGGLHVHLPEMRIAHDDYVLLCAQLQPKLQHQIRHCRATLDVVTHFSIATSGNPDTESYKPFRATYLEKNQEHYLPLTDATIFDTCRPIVAKQFKLKKLNQNSLFPILLTLDYRKVLNSMLYFMMPFVQESKVNLGYSTVIDTVHAEFEEVARFTLRKCNTIVGSKSIFKSSSIGLSDDPLVAYRYLSRHATQIAELTTENHALKTWYNRFKGDLHLPRDAFTPINQLLIEENQHLKGHPHPLVSVMEYDEGYYFLPVFYALWNHMQRPDLVELLRPILRTDPCPSLLDRLATLPKQSVCSMSESFSLDTLLYCAGNLWTKPASFEDTIDRVLDGMRNDILMCQTAEDVQSVVKRLQRRYVPFLLTALKDSSKRPFRIRWNLLLEQWQEVSGPRNYEISNLVYLLFSQINRFLRAHKMDKSLILSSKYVPEMVACIACNTSMTVKVVQMKGHKWLLKTDAGVLDLLTGHVGGTVPEFFLCEKTMSVSFPRSELMALPHREPLLQLFRLLVSPKVFRAFLKAIFLSEAGEDYPDLLRRVVAARGMVEDRWTESMLVAFVHLCKYLSFEHDALIYMLNVLASLLIATNYGKYFFILQGVVGNGKSKFFEMVNRVFGRLGQPVKSVNLKPGHGISSQPELASSMFSCRVITVEELAGKIDENVIKEVTGNSNVSFRNLYEASVGGIPTAKIMASTNQPPSCVATRAFGERVVVFPFNSLFVADCPSRLADQVYENVYERKENDALVNESYHGLFLLLYCYLLENVCLESRYLPYRCQPDSLVEFKEVYLQVMDMYVKFKQYADVQVVANTMTTESDLLSAVSRRHGISLNIYLDCVEFGMMIDAQC